MYNMERCCNCPYYWKLALDSTQLASCPI